MCALARLGRSTGWANGGLAALAARRLRIYCCRQMPRYRLGEELGHGALGRVVRVVDNETGASYAGKILHESSRGDESARQRFAREADLLASLAHPNVVGVHGLASVDGQTVLLMELVEGPSLAQLIAT